MTHKEEKSADVTLGVKAKRPGGRGGRGGGGGEEWRTRSSGWRRESSLTLELSLRSRSQLDDGLLSVPVLSEEEEAGQQRGRLPQPLQSGPQRARQQAQQARLPGDVSGRPAAARQDRAAEEDRPDAAALHRFP